MTASCAPYEISSPDDEQVDLDFLTQIAQITDGDDVEEDVLDTELIVPSPTKGSKTKREVSDDDVSSHCEMKQPKSRRVTEEDFVQSIDEALQDQRIDEKKAERLHECLQSGDWTNVAFSLLREQIPMKRKGNGYSCRVCQVSKKGHTCTYCHVCSTPEEKFKKDDEHVCMKCPMCFEEGKKKKKLVQCVEVLSVPMVLIKQTLHGGLTPHFLCEATFL